MSDVAVIIFLKRLVYVSDQREIVELESVLCRHDTNLRKVAVMV